MDPGWHSLFPWGGGIETDDHYTKARSIGFDFEIFIFVAQISLGSIGSCGSWRAVLKRGSFGMPKRGNLRKKTDGDEGEDAGAGAEEAPAIVIPPEKTKSKKKGKGKADGGMAASLLSFDDEEAGADAFR